MPAALFDMDRTLLAGSSAVLWTRYRKQRGEIGWGEVLRVAYWMVQYTFGVIDAERVAAKALLEFEGKHVETLAAEVELWFRDYVVRHVRDAGRRAVERHRRAGDLLAIVTASTGYTARPLARELGIDHVVSSELEVNPQGCLTGRAVTPLCYGFGKVERTERFAKALGFSLDEAVFYSDSITDLPLLERVAKPVAVCPDQRLRRAARERGWPVEWW